MKQFRSIIQNLKQSGIRSATAKCNKIGGLNLGQGICPIPVLKEIKERAKQAIDDDQSIYGPCEGILPLREKLSEKIKTFNNYEANPETEIMITHGATGAYVCAVETLLSSGDEVILFEPFYGYHTKILQLRDIQINPVKINLNNFEIDWDGLEKAVTPKTKAMVICTPCNPIGKVFLKDELRRLGEFALKNNLWIITDEIYEYITYPGFKHLSIASFPEFKNRTLTLSGFSKTYNMTGWRLGYASGPKEVIEKMALVQDGLYVCPSTPLQYGVLAALDLPESYYTDLATSYLKKRDLFTKGLWNLGFKFKEPQGAYYIVADVADLNIGTDQAAVDWLLDRAKVATVTGSSFYKNPKDGENQVRFCFAHEEQIIKQALENMAKALD